MRKNRKDRWGNLESVPKLSSRVIFLKRMTREAGGNLRGIHTLGIPARIPIVGLVIRIKDFRKRYPNLSRKAMNDRTLGGIFAFFGGSRMEQIA